MEKYRFVGDKIRNQSVLIRGPGDSQILIVGDADISGIIYCPKNTVAITANATGKVSFHGKCERLVVREMKGSCTLDLRELVCKELKLNSISERSILIAPKARIITQATLSDQSVLHVGTQQIITNSFVSDDAKILRQNWVRPAW